MSDQSAQCLSNEGYALLEQGRYPEALNKLNQALTMAPVNALILYRIGLVHLETNQLAAALAAFERALAYEPANARTHNNRGSCLEMMGHTAAAEAGYRRALTLDSKLPQPYINLGHLLETQNKKHEAIELYQLAIKRGLDATLFEHHLAAISGEVTDRAHENWVRSTFDNFASSFDTHLQQLGYDAPEKLGAMLRSHASAPLDILDLGCGTGLSGLALVTLKGSLTGVDLSEKMLIRARERGIYDALFEGEVHTWLRNAGSAQFNVVISADVFAYIGSLDEVFTEVTRVLKPTGWFTFTTEECETDDYQLLPTGRYKQSQDYIHRLAEGRFSVEISEPATIRIESGVPVAGRLYLLRKLMAR